ncbi:GAF domain-containing protein [Streptomyces sp. NPDC059629]|uniref:GAF domain-containing protein n=1 Tax=Streptomyces sp. NPDC059629 TaxID=3346889 RepID=UPI00369AC680
MTISEQPMARFPTADSAGSRSGPADDISDLLSFPDPARLELDHAVQDLVDRAGEVLRTRGRLRELLRAVLAITADISYPAVLDHVLTTACDLLHARYAALAVFDATGGLCQFLQAGAECAGSETVEDCRLGDESVVQQLAEAHQPLRIDDPTGHPVPVGWTPGPGPLYTFLGVPIRARGQTVGALYLGDKTGPRTEPEPFNDEDEELVRALVRAAGLAIDNARLFQQTRCEQAWQRASAEISAALLNGTDTDQALASIAEHARQVAEADLAAIAVPESADRLVIRLADGQDAHGLTGRHLPIQGSLCGHVLTGRKPLLTSHLAADERAHCLDAAWSTYLGPAMLAPLTSGEEPTGVLIVTRRPGRPAFDEPQLGALTGFATQATLAQHLAAQRADAEFLARVQDHERIAKALHDRVIEDIFGVGLALNSLATAAPSDLQHRILQTVDRLDHIIKDIRITVFDLQHGGTGCTRPEGPGSAPRSDASDTQAGATLSTT